MLKKKISKKEFDQAQIDALLRVVESTFKERRVDPKKPTTITIDKGGVLLDEKEKGDKLKTFVIIGWVGNNEMKEFVMAFKNGDQAIDFSKQFKKKYNNTRILKTFWS